jgi:transposase-like protein
MSAYLEQQPAPLYCSNEECYNHKNKVTVSPDGYWSAGYTSIGSPRWQCKLCLGTVSQPLKSTRRQKKSHDNVSIFRGLMNRSHFKALSRINGISIKTVYDKIDFIYNQCVAFAAHRERELPNLKKKWMEISVDRQEHIVNWFQTENKKNIRLHAVASVDNRSGYVFGSHLNYDPSLSLRKIEAEMHETKDHKQPPPFRKYARLWLRSDFLSLALDVTAAKLTREQKKTRRKSIDELVDSVYKEAAERPDVEAYDALDAFCRLPEWGMQVHAEYTLYGHFMFLRKLLGGVGYIRFYMDQDSGIWAACLGAFADRVLDKSCDAFYVKVGKELTQAEKLSRIAKWEWG